MNTKAKALADKIREWADPKNTTVNISHLLSLAAEVEALPEWPVELPYQKPESLRIIAGNLDVYNFSDTARFFRDCAAHLESQQPSESESDKLRAEVKRFGQKAEALFAEFNELKAKFK